MRHPEGVRGRHALATLLLATALQLSGCAGNPSPDGMSLADDRPAAVAKTAATAPGAAYGIRVDSLHLSAHGYILDLRYRVLDKDKAAMLLDARKKIYLVDDSHGAKLGVPQSPIIGGMRQTARNHVIYTDRDYFILFVNPGHAVQVGDTLKLAVDDTRIAELTVQ